jgi:hypothetical protein
MRWKARNQQLFRGLQHWFAGGRWWIEEVELPAGIHRAQDLEEAVDAAQGM